MRVDQAMPGHDCQMELPCGGLAQQNVTRRRIFLR